MGDIRKWAESKQAGALARGFQDVKPRRTQSTREKKQRQIPRARKTYSGKPRQSLVKGKSPENLRSFIAARDFVHPQS
jgi:hypothetical protein